MERKVDKHWTLLYQSKVYRLFFQLPFYLFFKTFIYIYWVRIFKFYEVVKDLFQIILILEFWFKFFAIFILCLGYCFFLITKSFRYFLILYIINILLLSKPFNLLLHYFTQSNKIFFVRIAPECLLHFFFKHWISKIEQIYIYEIQY